MPEFRRAPPRAIIVVSDQPAWQRRVGQVGRDLGLVPELVRWSEGPMPRRPLAAIFADLAAPFGEKVRHGVRWTSRCAQPVTLVSVQSAPGAAETVARLEHAGFAHVIVDGAGEDFSDAVADLVQALVAAATYLAPALARRLGTKDPRVLEALTAALRGIPRVRTVTRWADAVGTEARRLEILFNRRRLPPPRHVLAWLRLGRVVDWALRQKNRPTRDELARRFRYGDGRYLGKVATRLTGLPLGQLLDGGLAEFDRAMRERL